MLKRNFGREEELLKFLSSSTFFGDLNRLGYGVIYLPF